MLHITYKKLSVFYHSIFGFLAMEHLHAAGIILPEVFYFVMALACFALLLGLVYAAGSKRKVKTKHI